MFWCIEYFNWRACLFFKSGVIMLRLYRCTCTVAVDAGLAILQTTTTFTGRDYSERSFEISPNYVNLGRFRNNALLIFVIFNLIAFIFHSIRDINNGHFVASRDKVLNVLLQLCFANLKVSFHLDN